MQWLNRVADELMRRTPDGEIIISSGVSPSGMYHMGHLRELLISDAVRVELVRRGRQARHINIVDNMDVFRKVPVNVPADFEQYLGRPLCDIPAPDGSDMSYAEYFLTSFKRAAEILGCELDIWYSHEHYRSGYFVPAIERSLERLDTVRDVLQSVSGRKLDNTWSPIQVLEDGRLKNRTFVSLNHETKEITYTDKDGRQQVTGYANGQVKLDWRIDWPARWWLLPVHCEPFGRDHATKGGSYDTGEALMAKVFEAPAPLPVKYDDIKRTGDTQKMSASKGTGIEIGEAAQVLPPEVVRYFILRSDPAKQLYFDEGEGAIRLIDDFAALASKTDRSDGEQQLYELCTHGINETTVSAVPYSHLVANYQAALKNTDATIAGLARSEYKVVAEKQRGTIVKELAFIDRWLEKWAPEEVKFDLRQSADKADFSEQQVEWFGELAALIADAPDDADGEWFHKALYTLKEKHNLEPKDIFSPLYRLLINKDSGPRAGWFLQMLPRDWLLARLRFES